MAEDKKPTLTVVGSGKKNCTGKYVILSENEWQEARAMRETGATFREIAKRFGVAKSTVEKHAYSEGWGEGPDLESSIQRKVVERVVGVESTFDQEKRTAALNAEAEKRAKIIERHRAETDGVRERLYDGLVAHKAASESIKGKQNLTEKDTLLAYRKQQVAFETLKAARIAGDCMQIIHALERKAWGLDVRIMPKDIEKMSDEELEELASKAG